jgi:hypothetical protein
MKARELPNLPLDPPSRELTRNDAVYLIVFGSFFLIGPIQSLLTPTQDCAPCAVQ